MLSSKFPNEIVRDFLFNFVKIILLKSDNYALMVRKRLFYNAKPMLLHDKIVFKTQLVENKEVTLLIKLNW